MLHLIGADALTVSVRPAIQSVRQDGYQDRKKARSMSLYDALVSVRLSAEGTSRITAVPLKASSIASRLKCRLIPWDRMNPAKNSLKNDWFMIIPLAGNNK